MMETNITLNCWCKSRMYLDTVNGKLSSFRTSGPSLCHPCFFSKWETGWEFQNIWRSSSCFTLIKRYLEISKISFCPLIQLSIHIFLSLISSLSILSWLLVPVISLVSLYFSPIFSLDSLTFMTTACRSFAFLTVRLAS